MQGHDAASFKLIPLNTNRPTSHTVKIGVSIKHGIAGLYLSSLSLTLIRNAIQRCKESETKPTVPTLC